MCSIADGVDQDHPSPRVHEAAGIPTSARKVQQAESSTVRKFGATGLFLLVIYSLGLPHQ